MKTIIVIFALVLSGCSMTPKAGDYVGGEDRCYINSWGCNMSVKGGYLVAGVGVNLQRVGGEIGEGKAPSVINNMEGWNNL